jgi:hypothetical protein
MQTTEPAFYFALPRLCWWWNGGSAARTEANWLETNAVGLLVHGTVSLFAFQLLLAGLPTLAQLLLLVPLAFLLCVFWSVFFYLNALLIRAGMLGSLPRLRAQSLLIGILTSCLAIALVRSGTWTKWVGLVWLSAVALNVAAAALLALQSRDARSRR